jgi:hypothetical protein
LSTWRNEYYENKEFEIYANSERVTSHLRARVTKEKINSTPMPKKKGDTPTKINGY